MKKIKFIFTTLTTILIMCGITAMAGITNVTYTLMGVPDIDSSFKSYMDYRMITNHSSPQWAYIQQWGWSDGNGFMRADGERDLGILDDYYMVAMGSYYGTEIGTKYRITTDTGNVFYAVLCEQKGNADTDWLHQYGTDNSDVIEFIVDETRLDTAVMLYGSANVYMPLNGKVKSVERIEFVWEV